MVRRPSWRNDFEFRLTAFIQRISISVGYVRRIKSTIVWKAETMQWTAIPPWPKAMNIEHGRRMFGAKRKSLIMLTTWRRLLSCELSPRHEPSDMIYVIWLEICKSCRYGGCALWLKLKASATKAVHVSWDHLIQTFGTTKIILYHYWIRFVRICGFLVLLIDFK